MALCCCCHRSRQEQVGAVAFSFPRRGDRLPPRLPSQSLGRSRSKLAMSSSHGRIGISLRDSGATLTRGLWVTVSEASFAWAYDLWGDPARRDTGPI
ncbi:DUF2199 domain-containing protein [Streptomyces sp. NPDC060235]|uniref:DUF2199 domain-containing protein n=1 Tax=Streptomyces sp. NPDC060235 TaxID=3347080 RepID=UPI00365103BF